MIEERLENEFQSHFGHFKVAFEGMVAIHEDFRLNNWNESSLLSESSKSCQRVGVGFEASAAGNIRADGDDGPPFGEARAELGVFGQALAQTIEAFGDFLAGKRSHRLGAVIHLDARDDALSPEQLDQECSVS